MVEGPEGVASLLSIKGILWCGCLGWSVLGLWWEGVGERGTKVHRGSCSLQVSLRCDSRSLPSPWGNVSCLGRFLNGPSVALHPRPWGETVWCELGGSATQQGPALSTEEVNQWHLLSGGLGNGKIYSKLLPQCPTYLILLTGFFFTNEGEHSFFFVLFCFRPYRIHWGKRNCLFLYNLQASSSKSC